MAKTKNITIVSVRYSDWIIPYFGNKHYTPYGTLKVKGIVDGNEVTQYCKTHGDMYGDKSPYQYIIFSGQRFIVRNTGSLHFPKLELEQWHKQRVNGRLQYTSDYKQAYA